ncbi:MAG: hypothetical protein M1376_06515 [Planctomycetes bacterium]|nr:hypothetical protein [Planctomycetota bacterium]
MRANVDRIVRLARSGRGMVAVVIVFFVLLPCIVPILYAQPAKDPPDLGYELSRCTRVEIQFEPSTLEYFFPGDDERSLLNADECKALQDLRVIVSNSEEDIKYIALHDLMMVRGTYIGPAKGAIAIKNTIHLTGYKDDERLISFRVIGTTLRTDDGYDFEYPRRLPHLRLLTPQVWPFALRFGCMANLSHLHNVLSKMAEAGVPRSPTDWCDGILRHNKHLIVELHARGGMFECPDVQVCHYAMNPDCKPDSPEDTVLLFEAKAGWNQHGGPELFTLDNHDPKGGLVLLNDGTVKFIRTKEELKQLRWK